MKPFTKLKIGFVLDDSLDRIENGVQQYVLTLGSWLESHGHTIHYLTGGSHSTSDTVHSLSRNVAMRFNQNRMTIPLPANTKVIKTLLNREKFDVLHVQMPFSPFLAGRVISAAGADCAVVGTFHILPYGRLQQTSSKALALVQKRTLERFDAICSVSPAAQLFAKSHFGLDSIVIPNMINLTKWQSSVQPHPGRIVYLGRLVPRKGCMKLLQAITTMPAELRQKTEVLIASDGPDRGQLERYALQNNLSNVKFLGFINENDKADLLASAQLAVFPSLGGESFGIVLIEAMAAGAGVVLGGNNLGYASVLGDWPKSLLDVDDPSSMAHSLTYFLQHPEHVAKLHGAQQQAVKQYDVSVAGAHIQDMYHSALLHRRKEVR